MQDTLLSATRIGLRVIVRSDSSLYGLVRQALEANSRLAGSSRPTGPKSVPLAHQAYAESRAHNPVFFGLRSCIR